MEIKFCYRHPDTLAHFRCFHCKRSICNECRHSYGHHYFCSQECYWKFFLRTHWQRIRKKAPPALWIWNGLLSLLVLVLFYRVYLDTPHRAEPERAELVFQEKDLPYLRTLVPLLQGTAPEHRLVWDKPFYRLQLEAEPQQVVMVWRNQQPIATALGEPDGPLSLKLPLQPGRNLFQVVVMDSVQRLQRRKEIEVHFRPPRVRRLARSIQQIPTRRPQLALTFDGGSTGNGAEKILAILRRKNIRATMFLTGRFIERYPDLVKQMVEDGHEIGNHTYSHPHLTTYARDRRQRTREGITRTLLHRELLRTDSLFHQLTGRHMAPFWRAPYGEFNQEILTWAAELGYIHVQWTPGLDTFDWVADKNSPLYRTPDQIRKTILEQDDGKGGLNGAIVLMHLGTRRQAEPITSILPDLIDALRQRGYQPVTVGHLLQP